MGIADRIENILGKSLKVIAKDLNYDKSNIFILENKIEELQRECPEIYINLESCGHHRDGRTQIQYAKDLIASWIFEDNFLKELKSTELEIELNGADSERKILSSSKTKTTSDYIIKKGVNNKNIELMSSYTNYWKDAKKIDLRDNKYNEMASKEVILLCIDMFNKEFFTIDIKNCNAIHIPKHKPYGDKPAYSISLKSINPQAYNIEEIAKALKSYLS
ncbi:hypothetical protein [Aliarcobacter butzleri]|uniref:hypothetical protein n=1 Tax=Aliarcobacter butzleri TaxID=28197 RepID=UPI002B24373A|nr:hypothetical protein [Aliarcobacter butzleri]